MGFIPLRDGSVYVVCQHHLETVLREIRDLADRQAAKIRGAKIRGRESFSSLSERLSLSSARTLSPKMTPVP